MRIGNDLGCFLFFCVYACVVSLLYNRCKANGMFFHLFVEKKVRGLACKCVFLAIQNKMGLQLRIDQIKMS